MIDPDPPATEYALKKPPGESIPWGEVIEPTKPKGQGHRGGVRWEDANKRDATRDLRDLAKLEGLRWVIMPPSGTGFRWRVAQVDASGRVVHEEWHPGEESARRAFEILSEGDA